MKQIIECTSFVAFNRKLYLVTKNKFVTMKINKPLLLRLNGTFDDKLLFMQLLPILIDIEEIGDSLVGKVDFEKVQFFAHCAKQYGILEKNSELNKSIAAEKIKELRAKEMTYQQIAEWLNDKGYKTSRGKKFQKMQVKRLLDK